MESGVAKKPEEAGVGVQDEAEGWATEGPVDATESMVEEKSSTSSVTSDRDAVSVSHEKRSM